MKFLIQYGGRGTSETVAISAPANSVSNPLWWEGDPLVSVAKLVNDRVSNPVWWEGDFLGACSCPSREGVSNPLWWEGDF